MTRSNLDRSMNDDVSHGSGLHRIADVCDARGLLDAWGDDGFTLLLRDALRTGAEQPGASVGPWVKLACGGTALLRAFEPRNFWARYTTSGRTLAYLISALPAPARHGPTVETSASEALVELCGTLEREAGVTLWPGGEIRGRDERAILRTLLDGRQRSASERRQWLRIVRGSEGGPRLRAILIAALLEVADLDPDTAHEAARLGAQDQSSEVRMTAAEHTWKLGPRGVSILERLAEDEDEDVRDSARASLESHGHG